MANSFNSADILKGALQKAGELTDGSSQYQGLAIKSLNNAYHDILSGGSTFTDGDVGDPWPWALSRQALCLLLQPPLQGSVTCVNGSATITFGSAPTVSLQDWHIKIDATNDYYRIAAHSALSTTATLECVYADVSVAGSTFTAYKLIYDLMKSLPSGVLGILRLCAPIRIYRENAFDDTTDGKVYGVDQGTMDEKWPVIRLQTGIPDRFAEIYRSEAEYLLRINKPVLQETKVDMDFIPTPSDLIDSSSSIPLMPKQNRLALEYATAYFICQEKQHADSDKFFALAAKAIRAMRDQSARVFTQSNIQRGQLVPREDKLGRNRYKGVY